ncbi:hypothetical protein NPIL_673301 [Nephila pilipes]|uniref:DUF7041 domain-containing protein n=1 Tax=Nephila pilipes TaxID=299642 RepID=A0A8X6PPB6_NEPPI|nr:hypothetical protein NPIL_673301 [Nephila pilipes]
MSLESKRNPELEIARVAIKPRLFLGKRSGAIWFAQIEPRFNGTVITMDKTKFHSIITAVNAINLAGVRDMIRNTLMYKKRILDHYSQLEAARLKLIFHDLRLEGQKSFQHFMEVQHLATGNIDNEALCAL